MDKISILFIMLSKVDYVLIASLFCDEMRKMNVMLA